jgi:hypothetical protein
MGTWNAFYVRTNAEPHLSVVRTRFPNAQIESGPEFTFEFHHWRAGASLRSLVFGCYKEERTWERVEGEQEPWEQNALFDPNGLKSVLEYAKTDQEKRDFERIWREAELLPGRTEPSLDSRDAAWKVAEHFKFPGWS